MHLNNVFFNFLNSYDFIEMILINIRFYEILFQLFIYVCFEKSQVHKDKNTTSGSDHTQCVFYDHLPYVTLDAGYT